MGLGSNKRNWKTDKIWCKFIKKKQNKQTKKQKKKNKKKKKKKQQTKNNNKKQNKKQQQKKKKKKKKKPRKWPTWPNDPNSYLVCLPVVMHLLVARWIWPM